MDFYPGLRNHVSGDTGNKKHEMQLKTVIIPFSIKPQNNKVYFTIIKLIR